MTDSPVPVCCTCSLQIEPETKICSSRSWPKALESPCLLASPAVRLPLCLRPWNPILKYPKNRHIAGLDAADATSSKTPTEDFAAQLAPLETLGSRPLAGKRVAVLREMMGAGVDAGVDAAVRRALAHLGSLGATLEEVKHCHATSDSFSLIQGGN